MSLRERFKKFFEKNQREFEILLEAINREGETDFVKSPAMSYLRGTGTKLNTADHSNDQQAAA
ncbi:MAG: hypothetical protein A2Z83_06335 [Omnitrophica bacterium GWA2_52_8]|nr:MAG: hypothetical protein A2Z83_06335 [Omnitrophica bacterium GWA2_52_8]